MNESIRFFELSPSQRWLYAAHIILATGSFCLSIGTVLKLLEGGGLPHDPIFGGPTNGNTQPSSNRARDYFSSS